MKPGTMISMETFVGQVKQRYNDIMEQKSSDSEELYKDLNDWLGTVYPANAAEKLEELSDHLTDLYKAHCDVMGVPQETRCTVYPCYISSGAATIKLSFGSVSPPQGHAGWWQHSEASN